MKRLLLSFLLCTSLIPGLRAQQPCTARYYDTVFPLVSVTPSVLFGRNNNFLGVQQLLTMDIYQPIGDTEKKRPLIILCFGGSFFYGDKKSPDIVELCNTFAQKGYVCAAIDYRIGFNQATEQQLMWAVIRGVHDGKAAVRFFKKNFAAYGVDTSRIAMGGTSAGAFIGLHAAFLDDPNKLNGYPVNIADFGGIEGVSGNPGYSSKYHAVINFSGALGKASWIDDKNIIPIGSTHGTADGTVPYDHDTIVVNVSVGPVPLPGFNGPITVVDGSHAIDTSLARRGLQGKHKFYTWKDGGHTPYALNPLAPGTVVNLPQTRAYMDTTKLFLRDFLYHDFLGCDLLASVSNVRSSKGHSMEAYPNPADDLLKLRINSDIAKEWSGAIYDMNGRVVKSFECFGNMTKNISVDELQNGLYIVETKCEDAVLRSRFMVK